jgi:DNA-binding transcriptional LysR family regulator
MAEASARQIEVFQMVMRLGSASRAAAALHISQPAVTQLLQQLETASSLRLFDRLKGRLLPTPEAHALMEEVDRVYVGLAAVQAKITALQSHEDTVLRIGTLHAMAASVMPWVVAQFQRSYPRTRCLLKVDSSKALREALIQGTLDFAFVGDEADMSGLSSSLFYALNAVCVMPAQHALARRDRVTPQDLAEVPLIGLSSSDLAQQRLESALEAAGVRGRFVVETPYSHTQCALVLAGAGVAVTNPLVAREYLALGLRCLPLAIDLHFRAHLAFKPRQAQSRAAQEFIAICRASLSRGFADSAATGLAKDKRG